MKFGAVLAEKYCPRKDPARMDAFADLREEVALQVKEVGDEVVCGGRNGELAGFEIDYASVDGETGGLRFQSPDRGGRRVYGVDLPTEAGEMQSMAARTAREVERTARG